MQRAQSPAAHAGPGIDQYVCCFAKPLVHFLIILLLLLKTQPYCPWLSWVWYVLRGSSEAEVILSPVGGLIF